VLKNYIYLLLQNDTYLFSHPDAMFGPKPPFCIYTFNTFLFQSSFSLFILFIIFPLFSFPVSLSFVANGISRYITDKNKTYSCFISINRALNNVHKVNLESRLRDLAQCHMKIKHKNIPITVDKIKISTRFLFYFSNV
jgi:hypothetical protein